MHRVSFEVSQPQCFREKKQKNKHSLMPHLSCEDSSLVEMAHPGLLALHTWLSRSTPSSPGLLLQGPCTPGCSTPLPPPRARKVRGARGLFLSPSPRVPGKRRSRLSAETCRGVAEKGRKVGKAAAQQAAGHSLGTVTKARDHGGEDPQDRAGAACSARGRGLCLSASPPSPQTQTGASCPDCQ